MDVSFSWSEDIPGGYSFFSQHDEQHKEYFRIAPSQQHSLSVCCSHYQTVTDHWLFALLRGALSNVNCQINAKQLTSNLSADFPNKTCQRFILPLDRWYSQCSWPASPWRAGWCWRMKIVSPSEMEQTRQQSEIWAITAVNMQLQTLISQIKISQFLSESPKQALPHKKAPGQVWLIDYELGRLLSLEKYLK